MGYSFQIVSLPLEKLQSLWGCRDEALLERVNAARKAAGRTERPTIAQVILGGGHDKPHELGYALEALCFEVGRSAGEVDTRDVDRLQERFSEEGIDASLFDGVSGKWPVPIPDTPDYPLVGVFTLAQLKEQLAALKRLQPCGDEMKDFALEGALEAFGGAVEAGTDAIVFLH